MLPDKAPRADLTDAMRIRPKAILETVLYVDDIEAASDFYASTLNLPLVHGDQRMKVLRVTDQNFLLLFKTGTSGEPIDIDGGTIPAHHGEGSMHLAFSVDHSDVASWTQRLQDIDVPIESTVKWPSGETSLYFRDPAGNLVELATQDLWRDL